MADHTFLFEKAHWKSKGYFFDEKNKALSIEGETEIVHESRIWKSMSTFRLTSGGDDHFKLNLLITPFDIKRGQTHWESTDQSFGRFFGELIIEDEYIISVFHSEDNLYSGSEYMQMIDADHYKNKGVIFKGKVKLSSWSLKLNKTG